MNIKEIRELLELIEQSAVEEFELERSGVRIRIRKTVSPQPTALQHETTPLPGAVSAERAETAPPLREQAQNKEEYYVFKAPIVGTFYITPKPDAEPFVKIGDQVNKGTVLCVIEAMKIFNQIESDVDGELIRILVKNGSPVEYGQPLFEIGLTS